MYSTKVAKEQLKHLRAAVRPPTHNQGIAEEPVAGQPMSVQERLHAHVQRTYDLVLRELEESPKRLANLEEKLRATQADALHVCLGLDAQLRSTEVSALDRCAEFATQLRSTETEALVTCDALEARLRTTQETALDTCGELERQLRSTQVTYGPHAAFLFAWTCVPASLQPCFWHVICTVGKLSPRRSL